VAGEVAKRPLGDLGEQPPELILAHHPVRAQDPKQAMVEIGQRDVAGIRTTDEAGRHEHGQQKQENSREKGVLASRRR
jgi:hypothetical protein